MGGTSGVPIPFYPVHSLRRNGKPNSSWSRRIAVHHDRSVNIADAYTEKGFDFSGTQAFR